MNTQRLLDTSARGVHLLFDRATICRAFEQPAEDLRAVVDRELDAIQMVVQHLLKLPDAEQGRDFIAGLPCDLQHIVVLLYFELLDGQLRKGSVTLH